jgi:hypothetical protein
MIDRTPDIAAVTVERGNGLDSGDLQRIAAIRSCRLRDGDTPHEACPGERSRTVPRSEQAMRNSGPQA